MRTYPAFLLSVAALLGVPVHAELGCPENGPSTLLDIASKNPTGQLDFLKTLVMEVEFMDALNVPGPINLFVPIDAAWEKLIEDFGITLDALRDQPALVKRLLQYHTIVDGATCTGSLSGELATALADQTLTVSDDGNVVYDGNGGEANVIVSVPAGNGVAYIIDQVLLPIPDPESPTTEVDVSRLTTLFNRIDVSGDGLVSVDELKAAAAFAGIELTPEQIQQFEKAAGEGVDIDGFIAAAGQLLSGLSK